MPKTCEKIKASAAPVKLFHRLRAIESSITAPRLIAMRPRAQAELLRSVSRQYAVLAAEIEAAS